MELYVASSLKDDDDYILVLLNELSHYLWEIYKTFELLTGKQSEYDELKCL